MDRYDFEEQISLILNNAKNELDEIEFQMLLSKVEDLISEHECSLAIEVE